jgi:hypothetical protein
MNKCEQCSYYDGDEFNGECAHQPPVVVVGKFDELIEHARSYRPSVTTDTKACAHYKGQL